MTEIISLVEATCVLYSPLGTHGLRDPVRPQLGAAQSLNQPLRPVLFLLPRVDSKELTLKNVNFFLCVVVLMERKPSCIFNFPQDGKILSKHKNP